MAVFQRITEFFFKDYLNVDQDNYFPYNFLLQIVEFLIEKIDKDLYEELKSILEMPDPFWSASWILSWFTHEIKSIFPIYRIFDYLLVSHPFTIYYLSAQLTIQEIKRLKISHIKLVFLCLK